MDLKQEYRELMLRTEQARKRKLHPIWGELGLIAGQPRVLGQLLKRDHVTQRELSEACCMEPATLSRALDKLEAMGYVNREANPECRRSVHISLTEGGREMALEVRSIFTVIEGQMLRGFSEAEIRCLMEMTERVCENLENESEILVDNYEINHKVE